VGERIGAAYEALLVPDTYNIDGQRFEEFVALVWQLEVDNRLRQKELALKIGELMAAQEAPKSKAKRAVRVPRAALPDEPDAA
jgi:hypothetical protein